MYSLIDRPGLQMTMHREFAPFLVAFATAELFYKFKSFALECIAFLITWYTLSLLQSLVTDRRR